MLDKVQWEEGHVDPKFQKNHMITKSTTPEDYADIFLPLSRNMKGKEEMTSFGKIKKWTSLKAVISGSA